MPPLTGYTTEIRIHYQEMQTASQPSVMFTALSRIMLPILALSLLLTVSTRSTASLGDVDTRQVPFAANRPIKPDVGAHHGAHPPRIDYLNLYGHDGSVPPDKMRLHQLHVSGSWNESMDLTFFSDGCTYFVSAS